MFPSASNSDQAKALGFNDFAGYQQAASDFSNGILDPNHLGSYQPSQQMVAQAAATKASKDSQNNYNNLVASNTKNATDFLTKYSTDVPNTVNTANTKFSVAPQADLVNGLNTRIADLTSNMSNSGAGGFANANQVDAAINSRYVPQLNTATTNLNNSENLATNYANQLLAPDLAQEDLLKTNITTAMQGLTSTQASSLQAIMDSIDQGVSLTNTQLQAGEALAATVLNNANALTQQKNALAYTPIPQNNVTVNPANGQIVNPYLLATQNGGSFTP